MRIINLNPDSDIGASAWFVEIDGHRLLMDAGTHPNNRGPLLQAIHRPPLLRRRLRLRLPRTAGPSSRFRPVAGS